MRTVHVLVGCASLLAACTCKNDSAEPARPTPTAQAQPRAGSAQPAPPASGCDIAAHTWRQTAPAPGCPSSEYRFTANPDGTFAGTESGCLGLTGTARYDGETLTFEADLDGNRLAYKWPIDASCASNVGTGTWLTGPNKDKGGPSTLTLVR